MNSSPATFTGVRGFSSAKYSFHLVRVLNCRHKYEYKEVYIWNEAKEPISFRAEISKALYVEDNVDIYQRQTNHY